MLKLFGAEKVGLLKKVQIRIKNLINPSKQILFKGQIISI